MHLFHTRLMLSDQPKFQKKLSLFHEPKKRLLATCGPSEEIQPHFPSFSNCQGPSLVKCCQFSVLGLTRRCSRRVYHGQFPFPVRQNPACTCIKDAYVGVSLGHQFNPHNGLANCPIPPPPVRTQQVMFRRDALFRCKIPLFRAFCATQSLSICSRMVKKLVLIAALRQKSLLCAR
jgi:hypothetical protein